MHAFNSKDFPVLVLFLTVLITSLGNDSVAAGKLKSQITQQPFVIHRNETIKLPNTDIMIVLQGTGSEHHTDGTVVDNANIVATQQEKTLNLYLEIVDGTPATAEVFGYTLGLESCSAYHGTCKLIIYPKLNRVPLF